ncbi:MAG: DUF362 domain-containing protein [Proteobacteria bacterium]|jgi:uncharacterized protein (DUF362 family)|nr:DUF362 domain-containing protein [Pseudomonadota bacterium]
MRRDDDILLGRRDALKLGLGAAAALGAIGLTRGAGAAPAQGLAAGAGAAALTGPGHVVEVHKPGMRGRLFPYPDAAREAVHKAVTTLAGEGDLGRAFGKFVSPEDRVGIKINVLGGRLASTTKEIADAIVEGVRAAGVPDANIMIFDQFGGNMRGARYVWQEKPGQLRVINHEVLGYEDALTTCEGGGRGRLAKTLTWCTAVINAPVPKDHDTAGVTCAMKNMVFGCVERPPMMHQQIHTALPHFYALDAIRGRVRLVVCDGSFCLYDGGPKHNPSASVTHDRVYATTDPVAMDTIALEIVEKYRAENGLKTLAQVRRPATYLALAEEIGLGVADRGRIRLERIELPPYTPAS